jgi:uncharacterized protein
LTLTISEEGEDAMAKERIVSADSHVTIRDEAVLEHLASKHHAAYQEAKLAAYQRFAKPEGKERSEASAMAKDQETWEAAGRPGAWDPHARLKDMDLDKVDAEVLYTEAAAGASFYAMKDGAWLEAFQAFNSAAIDFASVDPDRLLPVYIIPIADVDEAVKELQRVANEGARAIHLPLFPTDLGLPGYWDPVYDPLWSAVQEAGLPISQHVGVHEGLTRVFHYDPTPVKGIFHSLPPIFMAEAMAGWIVTGLLARFPGLRVVFVEAGLGWIPYYLGRLDHMQDRHGWAHFDMLREKPSLYWRNQMAATFEEDEFGVRNRHDLGVENLMWATDYPHPDSTWPHSQEVIHTHFDDVPIEETRLMIGGNAARLYRL